MPKGYTLVKGFHGDINQIPKEYRQDVIDKFKKMHPNADIKDYMLDVDLYIDIALRNFYKKD
jgi:hypothetical protein